jgi:type IV secretory pathway VirB2 component (pilin)
MSPLLVDLKRMRLIEFILRGFLAWVVGLFFYMIAMMMTTYDGFISMICQPIMGSIMTSIALLLCIIIGSPLLFNRLWKFWEKIWWVSIVIIFISFLSLCLSWYPFKETVIDPINKTPVETFNVPMSLSGWMGMMFGIFYCPAFSIQWLVERLRELAGTDKKVMIR